MLSEFIYCSHAKCLNNLAHGIPEKKKEDIRFTFSRQSLPMTWDFGEGNPFSGVIWKF